MGKNKDTISLRSLTRKSTESIKGTQRHRWATYMHFVMSAITMSIGFGNYWRFPYVCYVNGGCVFLIPYFIQVATVGIPVFYMDLTLGQFTNKSSIRALRGLGRVWTSLGISQCLCCVVCMSYYGFILAISVYYMYLSFSINLPWERCRPHWGNDCVPIVGNNNISLNGRKSSSELFFYKEVLNILEDLNDGIGPPKASLCGCLIIVYTLSMFILIAGIKTYERFAYVSISLPILLMLVIIIKCATLEGSFSGFMKLASPQWEKLLLLDTWLAATSQSFFSLGIGYGIVITLGSFNSIHTNMKKAALVIVLFDTFVSLYGTVAMFLALGYLCNRFQMPVNEVMDHVMGIAFISYPEVISTFDTIPYVFAVLFFFMFLCLAIGCLCAYENVIATNILDLCPILKEWQAAFLVGLIGFTTGLMYTTPGGQAMYVLMEKFGDSTAVVYLILLELIAVFYGYGLQQWCWDIEFMTARKVSKILKWLLAIYTPIIMVALIIESIIEFEVLSYRGKIVPSFIQAMCYIVTIIILSPILIVNIYYYKQYRHEGIGVAFKYMYEPNFHHMNPEVAILAMKYKRLKLLRYPYSDKSRLYKFWKCLTKNT